MNYFLILIILGLCGGGYYEYTEIQRVQQDKFSADQQIIALDTKIGNLQSENKKLEDDKAQLTKSLAEAPIANQTNQVGTEPSAPADTGKQTLQPSNVNTTTASAPPTNNLGTITTLDGKTFQNCQLLKVDADGIVVNHSDGITKIMYGLMPPDLQKKFGYDPSQGTVLSDQQVQVLEEEREAAAKTAGK